MGQICRKLLDNVYETGFCQDMRLLWLSLFHIRTLASLRIAATYCIEVLVRQCSISTLAALCQLFGNTAFHIRTAFVRHRLGLCI